MTHYVTLKMIDYEFIYLNFFSYLVFRKLHIRPICYIDNGNKEVFRSWTEVSISGNGCILRRYYNMTDFPFNDITVLLYREKTKLRENQM